MGSKEFAIKIKLLTPIWTGDADRKNTTLRETGIIGSLRWWYEALIRGFNGTACDPTNTNCKDENHCDACELFGCTGRARKFRLEVEETNNEVTLKFIELRKVKDVEWALLNKTLKIIADYGALGGKIAESNFGLIEIERNDLSKFSLTKTQIEDYLKRKGSRFGKTDIKRFIFINKDLQYPMIKNIKSSLGFLKGKRGKAKRYFYKTIDKKPNRFFAYAENNDEYKQMKEFLNESSVKFTEGKEILEGLQ